MRSGKRRARPTAARAGARSLPTPMTTKPTTPAARARARTVVRARPGSTAGRGGSGCRRSRCIGARAFADVAVARARSARYARGSARRALPPRAFERDVPPSPAPFTVFAQRADARIELADVAAPRRAVSSRPGSGSPKTSAYGAPFPALDAARVVIAPREGRRRRALCVARASAGAARGRRTTCVPPGAPRRPAPGWPSSRSAARRYGSSRPRRRRRSRRAPDRGNPGRRAPRTDPRPARRRALRREDGARG